MQAITTCKKCGQKRNADFDLPEFTLTSSALKKRTFSEVRKISFLKNKTIHNFETASSAQILKQALEDKKLCEQLSALEVKNEQS